MNDTIQAGHIALVSYLMKRSTKEALARTLADIAYGRPWSVPSEEVVIHTITTNPRKGRPSREELAKKMEAVWAILDEMFPIPVTLDQLALGTNLTLKALERVRDGEYPEVLEGCPWYHRTYFQSLPTQAAPITTRLIGPWRAALDFHAYHLATQYGPVPDLFTTHAVFWSTKGIAHAGQAGRLEALNKYEMRRVRQLAQSITEAVGWDALPPPGGTPITPSHNAQDCPPLLAFHSNPLPPLTLWTFIQATGTPHEWWDMPEEDVALPGMQAQAILLWAIDYLKEKPE